jgi:hypothetical protein
MGDGLGAYRVSKDAYWNTEESMFYDRHLEKKVSTAMSIHLIM